LDDLQGEGMTETCPHCGGVLHHETRFFRACKGWRETPVCGTCRIELAPQGPVYAFAAECMADRERKGTAEREGQV
jgi:hypothetical protein